MYVCMTMIMIMNVCRFVHACFYAAHTFLQACMYGECTAVCMLRPAVTCICSMIDTHLRLYPATHADRA